MVSSDVVADLQRNRSVDSLQQRGSLGVALDIGSAEYLDLVHFVLAYRRNNHIIVDMEHLGELELGHIAELSRVSEVACECRSSSKLRRYEVYLTVLGSRASEEVSVEGTQ